MAQSLAVDHWLPTIAPFRVRATMRRSLTSAGATSFLGKLPEILATHSLVILTTSRTYGIIKYSTLITADDLWAGDPAL
jgi:hypothetical protein